MPAHEVEVQYAVPDQGLPGRERIQAWVGASLAGRDKPAELVVRVVDEGEIRRFNKRFRHLDRSTNVLSFPCTVPGAPALLGDLLISAPVVEREAREQGKPLEAHFAHMVVHGVLHLLGYDHLDDAEAEDMEAAERRILRDLGYDDPY